MNTLSTSVMSEVNRLTRSGDPLAATTLIQSALSKAVVCGATSGALDIPLPRTEQGNQSATMPTDESIQTLEPALNVSITGATTSASSGTVSNDPQISLGQGAVALPSFTDGQARRSASTFIDGLYPTAGRPMHYKLFTPARDTSEPAPLLVMLHGCTQDAQDFAIGTAMNTVAEKAGIYVLYPTQSTSANLNRCWNWFEPPHQEHGYGEPASISGLTQQIIETHPIDTTQVFVAGLSAGGAMALIMAEQYPELYAAVGVHSGLPTGVASSMSEALRLMGSSSSSASRLPTVSEPSGGLWRTLPFRGFSVVDGQQARKQASHGLPTPTIIFHGAQDRTVNPGNADRIVSDWLARQTDSEGQPDWVSTTDTVMMQTGREYTVTRYTGERDDRVGRCEHWVLANSGHRWSGGNAAGSHTDAQGPDASEEMVRFFLSVA